MNNYNLIMKLQAKMQDPRFSERFNRIVSEFNSIPGVQQEVMRIAQIEDERKRERRSYGKVQKRATPPARRHNRH